MAMAATLLTAGSSLISGISGFAASNYQAQVAKNNAKIAEENARRAIETGQQDKMDNDLDIKGIIGEQTAVQAGSGLALSSRSSQAVRRSTRMIGEMEGSRIMGKATQEVKNFNQQAADFKSEAAAHKTTGMFDLAGGVIGAAASVAGGVKPGSFKSLASKAQPTAMNGRFVPRPRLKPTYFRALGSATYGGPR